MRQKRLVILTILSFLVLGTVATASSAQSSSNYTVGLMLGIGGSTDTNPDTEFDNSSFQALFAMKRDRQTAFTVRAGQLDLDSDEAPAFDSTLRYVTLGGEYRLPAGFYESGLYIALGAYDLDGDLLVEDENAFGIAVGVTGDFRINDRFSVLAEFSGHYADLDYKQIFLMAHVGFGFHF